MADSLRIAHFEAAVLQALFRLHLPRRVGQSMGYQIHQNEGGDPH